MTSMVAQTIAVAFEEAGRTADAREYVFAALRDFEGLQL
jgi:hypothetical protein